MATDAPALVAATVTELLPGGSCRVRTEDGRTLSAVLAVELADGVVSVGGRVALLPSEGEFTGMIVRLEAPPTPARQRSRPFGSRGHGTSPEQLKIDRTARPAWLTGADRTPVVGEEVYCTEGLCSVARVLGRTGNGSRLLELRLDDRRLFFAAASNVLVHPRSE